MSRWRRVLLAAVDEVGWLVAFALLMVIFFLLFGCGAARAISGATEDVAAEAVQTARAAKVAIERLDDLADTYAPLVLAGVVAVLGAGAEYLRRKVGRVERKVSGRS